MLALGSVAFLCGFIGPIVLNPDANQGPLLGIFITGPLGAFLGLIFGVIAALSHLSRQTFTSILAVLATAAALCTLFFCLPGDEFQGFVIDARTVECESPSSLVDDATARWEKWNAENTWRAPRPRWREEIGGVAAHDRGVVLRMVVLQRWDIYERRKPWNRGHLVSRASTRKSPDHYFVRSDQTCDRYRIGDRALYAPRYEPTSVSPPDVFPTFLGLYVLDEVPSRYRAILNR